MLNHPLYENDKDMSILKPSKIPVREKVQKNRLHSCLAAPSWYVLQNVCIFIVM